MADNTSKKPASKIVYILPNLFTVGSMFSAFLGLIMAHNGNFGGCAIAILISALLDGMDGKVARLTHSASDFGVQLDSLADAIAFGLTPAFMIYFWQLKELGRLGIAVSFLFMACGVLRLARFNVMASTSASKRFFTGLPIPAAGCALACLVLFQNYLPQGLYPVLRWFTLLLTFALGLLMVSRIPYFAFKEFSGLRVKTFNLMVGLVVVFAAIVAAPKVMGFLLFIIYLASGPVLSFMAYKKNQELKKAAANGATEAASDKTSPVADEASADEEN